MSHEVRGLIRQAVAHERAAGAHDDKQEQQMKAAGASLYAAFEMAMRASEEFQGRQIDDKIVVRECKAKKKKKWWDAALTEAEVEAKDPRDWARKIIQWHTDPGAAQANRGKLIAAKSTKRKLAKNQRSTSFNGSREPLKNALAELAAGMAIGERASTDILDRGDILHDDAVSVVERQLARIHGLIRKAPTGDVEDAAETLEAVCNDLVEAVKQASH